MTCDVNGSCVCDVNGSCVCDVNGTCDVNGGWVRCVCDVM